jgi:hypothetical protein
MTISISNDIKWAQPVCISLCANSLVDDQTCNKLHIHVQQAFSHSHVINKGLRKGELLFEVI